MPDLESEESDDCAAIHLHSRAAAPADIVSAEPPTDADWAELEDVARGASDSLRYPEPFE
jgi:hypothetical protein